jgi:hydroxymethylbilane synthase
MILRIGTRGSKLALTQSQWVKGKIESVHPGVIVELVRIATTGDKFQRPPLSEVGGKGLFIKEIEEALLRKEVDLGVHSMKDVPAGLPEGLEISIFPQREDPRDAFVSEKFRSIEELPRGSSVGTSSLRRASQLLHLRPDLRVIPIRGNVDTRLRKLESGQFDALMLASAGLRRLGLSHRITQMLSTDLSLPAIGQGVLGLEVRMSDHAVQDLLGFLNHGETELTVRAERAFLKELEGGCQVPLAGYGKLNGDRLELEGMVAELDGSVLIRDKLFGSKEKPEDLGVDLAKKILASGGDKILQGILRRIQESESRIQEEESGKTDAKR